MTELLAGCGSSREMKKKPPGCYGWIDLITLDFNADHNSDIVHDLTMLPYPLDDNTFDQVHFYDVLEHLSRQGDYLTRSLINSLECKGARADILYQDGSVLINRLMSILSSITCFLFLLLLLSLDIILYSYFFVKVFLGGVLGSMYMYNPQNVYSLEIRNHLRLNEYH